MAVTLQQFIDSLTQSGLMTADEVSSFLQSQPAEKQPNDAQTLAQSLVQAGKLTKYQAQMVYQGRPKGLVFGEYTVLDKLGQGGMGVVLKAQHRRMKRLVAVKVLSASAMKSPDSVKRFYREVEAAAKLNHPNIVQSHDASEHEGIHYLVMEYVEGSDLGALLKRHGPLPIPQAINCILQAARGLEYAHRHGIVHRDIKPGNLLIDQEGTVKILDMGLARLTEMVGDDPAAHALTGTGQIMGTIDYMSPEQAEDTRQADHRSDIYSLGCTLYRLVTGQAVYQGDTVMKALLAHRERPIPRMRDLRLEASEDLDAVFQRMVAKQREDRYPSMSEVIVDLEACLAAREPAAVTAVSEPPEESSVNGWLEQISSPGPLPVATQRGEATMVRRAEDETHKTVHGKLSVIPANQRLWIAVGVAGGLALLLILAFVLGRGGKPPATDTAQRSTGATTAKTQPVPTPVDTPQPRPDEKKSADFGDLPLPTVAMDSPPKPAIPEEPRPKSPQWQTAWKEAEARAKSLLDEKKYSEARAVVKAAIARHSVAEAVEEGEKLLAKIAAAEKQQPPKSDKPADAKPTETNKPGPLPMSPEQQKQSQADARHAEALASVEKLAAAWDFAGALTTSKNVRFAEEESTQRLGQRREELKRLGAFKGKIIESIKAADPPLKKSALGVRGLGGDVVAADDEGITCKLINGKTELLAWGDLGPKATTKLAQLAVDPAKQGDWLEAGLLALVVQDPVLGEKCFERAQTLGAKIDPYLTPLAAASLARAKELLEKRQFTEARAALENLGTKYSGIPWVKSHAEVVASLRAAAKAGIQETEAEKLYAEAAELFARQEFFDVKPLVGKLKTAYAATRPVTDQTRKPTFADLEKATAGLGRRLIVRRDGKGDFKGIQEAIDAAPVNSLIEIQDNGPYNEKIGIGKEGLTIRGKRGCWPIITSVGPVTNFPVLVSVGAPRVTMERVVLVHGGAAGDMPSCIHGWVSVRSSILFGVNPFFGGGLGAEDSVIVGAQTYGGCSFTIKNSVWLAESVAAGSGSLENVVLTGSLTTGPQSVLRLCTFPGFLKLSGGSSRVAECILLSVQSDNRGDSIDYCDVHGKPPFINEVKPGKGCFSADPQFVDPANLDYRLRPTSPCRGRASDGGDVGCRYTPQMIEMLKLAFELRAKGIIKF